MVTGSGDDSRPDTGARNRDRFAEIGERTRQSIERALDAEATSGELAVLLAVVYWLSTFSRSSDTVSLGKIAASAGMWDGEHDECPRWITKRVAERLTRLEKLGAVDYRPGRGGRVSVIQLPPILEGAFLRRSKDDGNTMNDRRSTGAATAPLETSGLAAQGEQVPRAQGEQSPRVNGSSHRASTGAPTAPPPEEDPRDTEGSVREARARQQAGSPVARPTAGAATDPPPNRLHDLIMDLTEPDDMQTWADAVAIADHLEAHLPAAALDRLRDGLRAHTPANVRLVMRIAREIADEEGIQLPRLDLRRLKAVQ
jgi:hypothetical protein